MLTGTKVAAYLNKIQWIISTCVIDAGLHIMNLCEVGSHQEGFKAAGIQPGDMQICEGKDAPTLDVTENYLTAYGFDADATTTRFGVRETVRKKTYKLTSQTAEPLLVVHSFENHMGALLTLGNLHIRTPHGATVTIKTRRRLVVEALKKLESDAPSHSGTQPSVLVLLGDCNLSPDQAEEATQQVQPEDRLANWQTVWQVHATTEALSGDLMFVKGAHAQSFDLPFGHSHRDHGVRNNCHDAIGIELRVPLDSEPPRRHARPRQDDGDSSQPARDDGDASEPARDGGGGPQPARAADAMTRGACVVEAQIRQFWDSRGEEGALVQREIANLRPLLFRKKKHPVRRDLWFPGSDGPGEEQHVEAVVSETFVLNQIKEVIELRETWLQENDLPMDFVMRDNLERKDFLQYAKGLYHAEHDQQTRQKDDLDKGGAEKVRRGKHSRWHRELQRRLGSPALWNMVSFTGRFDENFLQTIHATVVPRPEPRKDLTRLAQRARDHLRWGQRLHRQFLKGKKTKKDFTLEENQMIRSYADGHLLDAANEATLASGWGRIKNFDGSFKDINPVGGGIVRTVLDKIELDELPG